MLSLPAVPRSQPIQHRGQWLSVLLLILNLSGSFAQTTPGKTTTIAHEEINVGQPANFTLFDADFYRNHLFLLGESHGVAKPQELDFALFKHLNERAGVRHYVAEVDFVKAQYLNEYLKTGDEATLMRVFRSWVNEQAQWANRDFVRKIQRIRTWNLTLPANRTVQFVGIDVVQDNPLTATYLTGQLTGKKLSLTAQPLADSLLARLARSAPDSLAAKAALAWLADMQANEAGYRKAFGTNFDTIRHVVTNVCYLKTIRSRENVIVTNFKTLYDRLKLHNQKLYGFWGGWHVLQAPTVCANPAKCTHPMAAQLRESDLPLHDKIVSISCSYVDCRLMTPSQYLPPMWQEKGKKFSGVAQFNNDGEMMRFGGIDELKANSQPNTLTLFKLAGSDYGKSPVTVAYSPFMPAQQRITFDASRPATDYFQYVVLVRNSPMTEPLEP